MPGMAQPMPEIGRSNKMGLRVLAALGFSPLGLLDNIFHFFFKPLDF